MRVEVPLHQCFLNGDSSAESAEKTGEQIHQTLANRYHDEPFLRVAAYRGFEPVDDFLLDPTSLNDTNRMELHVLPNRGGHVVLVALLDNLGKGASGVAIQSLNLMLGLGETTGLPA
jgi:N-acetyl-gamma-glutamyl-phosphate reductase